MARAFIALGSNLGDGRQNLLAAWRQLGELTGVTPLRLSSPYLTKPVAKPEWLAAGIGPGAQSFTNGVGIVECRLPPLALLAAMQAIEANMGRDRQRTVDRRIDLDLLYYDEVVREEKDLVLPHPELQKRRFVLLPLTEVAPEFLHPRLGLTSRQLLAALPADVEAEILRLTWPEPLSVPANQSRGGDSA